MTSYDAYLSKIKIKILESSTILPKGVESKYLARVIDGRLVVETRVRKPR